MPSFKFVKLEKLSLLNHPEFREKWVQDRIAEDPSILELGDLILKDKERIQPRAGRLDLLLQDAEADTRYEVEIQLGGTDESHIIRTIEYWDLERKRYPQYDHYAVIVAEDITSRFLNIVSLFNGFIPLIAIQMNAVTVGDQISLVFTKVVDALSLGTDEEEEGAREVTDRNYWETFRGTKETVLDGAGIDVMDYDRKSGRYRLRLSKGDVQKHSKLLARLCRLSYGLPAEAASIAAGA